MKEWYCKNGLKINSNKTQCILFATPNFNKRTETFQITIDDTVRHMEDKVKNLGVTQSGASASHTTLTSHYNQTTDNTHTQHSGETPPAHTARTKQ